MIGKRNNRLNDFITISHQVLQIWFTREAFQVCNAFADEFDCDKTFLWVVNELMDCIFRFDKRCVPQIFRLLTNAQTLRHANQR